MATRTVDGTALVICWTAALIGCAAAPPPSLRAALAPAGTVIGVALATPISSIEVGPEDPIEGHLAQALVGADGQTLARQGAGVRGRVVSVENGRTPVVRLRLEAIETVAGWRPLGARVVGAAPYALVGPSWTPEAGDEAAAAESALYALGPPVVVRPDAESRRLVNANPRAVVVPAEATLELMLVTPLVAAGTVEARR